MKLDVKDFYRSEDSNQHQFVTIIQSSYFCIADLTVESSVSATKNVTVVACQPTKTFFSNSYDKKTVH